MASVDRQADPAIIELRSSKMKEVKEGVLADIVAAMQAHFSMERDH